MQLSTSFFNFPVPPSRPDLPIFHLREGEGGERGEERRHISQGASLLLFANLLLPTHLCSIVQYY